MTWYFDCKVGRVWLRPHVNGRFMLGVDDEPFTSKIFKSPELAAEAVYNSTTGHAAIDRLGFMACPFDLDGWAVEHDARSKDESYANHPQAR